MPSGCLQQVVQIGRMTVTNSVRRCCKVNKNIRPSQSDFRGFLCFFLFFFFIICHFYGWRLISKNGSYLAKEKCVCMHERVQMYLQNLFLCVFAINSAVLSTLLTASFAHAPAEISGALDTFRLNSYLQNWVTLSGCDVQMSENSNCPYLHVIQCFLRNFCNRAIFS